MPHRSPRAEAPSEVPAHATWHPHRREHRPFSPSASRPPHHLLDLQRLVGNRVTTEHARSADQVEPSTPATGEAMAGGPTATPLGNGTMPSTLGAVPASSTATARPGAATDELSEGEAREHAADTGDPAAPLPAETERLLDTAPSPPPTDSASASTQRREPGPPGSAPTTPTTAAGRIRTEGPPTLRAAAPSPAQHPREVPTHPLSPTSAQALSEEAMLTASDLDEELAEEWGAPNSSERRQKVAEAWEQANLFDSAVSGATSGAMMGGATLAAQKVATAALFRLGVSQAAKVAGPIGALVGGYGAVQSLWGKARDGAITTHEWAGWDGGYAAWADNLAVISDVLAFLGDLVGIVSAGAGILAGVGLLALVPGLQFLAALIPPSLTVLKVTGVAGLVIGILQVAAQIASTACRREHLLTMELTDESDLIAQQQLLSKGATELAGAAGGAVGGGAVDAAGRLGDRVARPVHERRVEGPVLPGGAAADKLIVRRQRLSADRLQGVGRVDDAFGRPDLTLRDVGRGISAAAKADGSARSRLDAFDQASGRGRRTYLYTAQEAALRRRALTLEAANAKDAAVTTYENQRRKTADSRQRAESLEQLRELTTERRGVGGESDIGTREVAQAQDRERTMRTRLTTAEAETTRIDQAIEALHQSLPPDAERMVTPSDLAGLRKLDDLHRRRREAAAQVERAHAEVELAGREVLAALERREQAAARADELRRRIRDAEHSSQASHERSRQAERAAFEEVSRRYLHLEQEQNLLRTLERNVTDAARRDASHWKTAGEIAGAVATGATGGAGAALTDREQQGAHTEDAPRPDQPPSVTSAHIIRLGLTTVRADALAAESSADAVDAAAARAHWTQKQAELDQVAAGLDAAGAETEQLSGALDGKAGVRDQLEEQHEQTAEKIREPAGRFTVLDSFVATVQSLLGLGSRLEHPELPETVQKAGRSLGETGTGIKEGWGTARTAFTGHGAHGARQASINAAGRARLEQTRTTVPQTRSTLAESQAHAARLIAEAAAAAAGADRAHAESTATGAAASDLAATTHARHEAAVTEYEAWGRTHEAAREQATQERVRALEESGYEVDVARGVPS